ncbi:MAG TPA: SGNH/GDSL hydrolase family protein [Mycobacterium sp.]|uniref:SGNH/GDSL hydrolase family protein n=1 Tax=Mycobacterium sp. TaxID=1785 RepID=UPI002F41799E
MTRRYVALGSSMAAGPGIRPAAPGAPFGSGRSARNYAHLVADRLNLALVDVTFSGATTAHLLAERQRRARPQIDALDGTEELVTITVGGNDVGYVPLLMAASLPAFARRLAPLAGRVRELFDRDAREQALDGIGASLCAVGTAVRRRAPRARVLFVDYLTLLPAEGVAAAPLSAEHADLGRFIGTRLEEATAAAAQATGCELVRAGHASRNRHGWSTDPWAAAAGLPLPWRPAPFHPNAAGMRAVADLILEQTDAD